MGHSAAVRSEDVVYVWFDALINYAAAVGYGWDDDRFRKWWPADLHIIGKDITRFHCVIWPAMLMSAKLPLPGQVFGHGWISVDNQRMSKSLGNVVDPARGGGTVRTDPLRLYLVKEVPYGGDGDFTWERLGEKYNADLANNLGNLVSRVSAMTERYRDGRLQRECRRVGAAGRRGGSGRRRLSRSDGRLALHEGVAAAFRIVDAANLFIADTQPWALAKDEAHADRLTNVLAECGGSRAHRRAAAAAGDAVVGRRDPAPSGRNPRRAETSLDGRAWRTSGEKQILNEGPLWPREGRREQQS